MGTQTSSPTPPPILTDTGVLGRELTRRTVLKGAASGAAALGLGALWPSTAYGSIGGPGGLVARSDLLMLVNRVSQGFTTAEFTAASTHPGGYAGYLASVIAGPASSPIADGVIAGLQPFVSYTPWQYITSTTPPPNIDDLLTAAQLAAIQLSARSERVLLERMMELWSTRLSVYGKKAGNGSLKNYSDYHILRPHALGDVRTLLTNFARDTSVLYYLDNVLSSGPVPNENWAREFLELYTMGQNDPDPAITTPNYSEADVQAAAKAFTGWTWDLTPSPNLVLFTFLSAMHLNSPSSYLFQGLPITPSATTTAEGDQVVSITVNSNKTARGIAGKMIRHLLRYDPQPAQVTAAAAQYPNVGAMVSTILAQPNIAALTPSQYLFSSPARFVAQALRATGAQPTAAGMGLIQELQRMGNAPFEWPAPDGYPDEPEKWLGGIFSRWQFANKLFAAPDATGANPELPGVVFTDTDILALVSPFTTVMSIINNLDARLTGGILSVNEKCVLEAFVNLSLAAVPPVPPVQILRELLALCISTPSFQYY